MSKPAPVSLLICSTCSGERNIARETEAIRDALTRAGLSERVALREHACMNGCANPVTIGLQGQGMASYVFAGVAPITDADDIAATCSVFLKSDAGWIEDARPCGRLRQCLRARLPAL